MSGNAHVPVLLEPVLQGLNVKPDGLYIDGTYGRGGHSGEILQRLDRHGRLIAVDRDPQAIAAASDSFRNDPRTELIRSDIARLKTIISDRKALGAVDGLLLDLGVSSPQLDEADRGFSFLRDGPLDMRMDPDTGQSARDWLASVEEREMKRVISKFGEEKHAARIARAITAARETQEIRSTAQLAAIVDAAVPAPYGKPRSRKHPATKTFQAIRIAINDELYQLEAALAQSLDILKSGGRLCVISFHSLEDRLVKRFMRKASQVVEPYRGLPSIPDEFMPTLKIIGRAIAATAEEIAVNPRARSARLRVAERT